MEIKHLIPLVNEINRLLRHMSGLDIFVKNIKDKIESTELSALQIDDQLTNIYSTYERFEELTKLDYALIDLTNIINEMELIYETSLDVVCKAEHLKKYLLQYGQVTK